MSLTVEEIEWSKIQEIGYKTGYVDGITLGGESKLQRGFDRGYATGFETSYPVSIVRGLLVVNELRLRETKSPLLDRSMALMRSLVEFEMKCNDLRMKCLMKNKGSSEFESDITDELQNLNVGVHITTSNVTEDYNLGNEKGYGDCIVNANQLNVVIHDLNELKRAILNFLQECNQPLILDQLIQVFQNWDLQHLARHDFGEAECSSHHEPTRADGLPALSF